MIDAAKAVGRPGKPVGRSAEPPCFVAIPTTSGTGSEVTAFSVVKARREAGAGGPSLLPDIAVLDPALVASVPPAITADTGMDAVSRLEAYSPSPPTTFPMRWRRSGAAGIRFLPTCWRNGGDLLAREKMHNASCMAGMASPTRRWALPSALRARRRVSRPHGRANALLMADVVAWNA